MTLKDVIIQNYPKPIAHFGLKQVIGPPPLIVEFADSSFGKVTSCIWYFGNGDTSMVQNPTYTYTEPDTYSVKLIVFGPGGSDTLALEDLIIVQDVTGIDRDAGLPTDFSLEPVYPNPFNPAANIRFSLPKQTNVQIEIYNIRGERVDQVNLGNMPPGMHQWIWDAAAFNSGTYLVRIQTSAFHEVRKCVLMR